MAELTLGFIWVAICLSFCRQQKISFIKQIYLHQIVHERLLVGAQLINTGCTLALSKTPILRRNSRAMLQGFQWFSNLIDSWFQRNLTNSTNLYWQVSICWFYFYNVLIFNSVIIFQFWIPSKLMALFLSFNLTFNKISRSTRYIFLNFYSW